MNIHGGEGLNCRVKRQSQYPNISHNINIEIVITFESEDLVSSMELDYSI